MSYVGIYYCCNMVMIALTSVVSIGITHATHRYQDQPVPLWARKVCTVVVKFELFEL